MPDEMTEERLRMIERERLQSLVTPDLHVAKQLHAEDYELITPGGAALSKRDYLGSIESGDLRYTTFEPTSDIRVRIYGEAAIARYRVRIEVVFDGTSDAGDFWHTDLYELRGSQWQAVWSHATRIRT